MLKIKFEFAKGGVLYGYLNPDLAPKTIIRLQEVLPFDSVEMHTRWCGREIFCGLTTKTNPPRENKTGHVSKFDISYWRDWEGGPAMAGTPAMETISLFYGPEKLHSHNGPISVNVIGHVDYTQEALLKQIGERIWLEGAEAVTVSLAE